MPIKVVSTRENDVKSPEVNPGGPKPLCDVTPQMRVQLSRQVGELRSASMKWFNSYIGAPSVGKVILKEKALCKSHRPTYLLSEKTCPVIGVASLGELLVELSPEGILHLEEAIIKGSTKRHLHDLSTIERIAPYTEKDVLPENVRSKVQDEIKIHDRPIKVELFSFSDKETDKLILRLFEAFLSENHCVLQQSIHYSDTLTLHEVRVPSMDVLNEISAFRPVRRLSFFPQYRPMPVSAGARPLHRIGDCFPTRGFEYPTVAVVDSGIPEDHPKLSAWVIGREQYVPSNLRNHHHGTFVGGILAHSHLLEPDKSDDIAGCNLLDICVLPNDDPKAGPRDKIGEIDLITRLEDAVNKYAENVKVWNLSLGFDGECDLWSISDLATKLDAMADEHKVVFVIACGNYEDPPLRGWPPQKDISDRIRIPADVLRGISVGSVAAKDNSNSLVRANHPSPFSRRGPGPLYLVKPDLVHFGGNCDTDGVCTDTGVLSWTIDGEVGEGIGTSFATPRVSRLLAGVYSSMESAPSANLAKALLIHSALFPGEVRRPEEDELGYYGFGLPGTLNRIITCSESAATLIWESQVSPGLEFRLDDFPYPNCLKENGLWKGEIWMTLVYNPPLDRRNGFEHVRLNLDAHLGVYRWNSQKKQFAFKTEVPAEASWPGKYEKSRIEHGYKWSPVKVYRRRLPKGITGDHWCLSITPLVRSGEKTLPPQDFALIVTIADPDGQDVYTDIVQQLQARFPINDLALKQQVRVALSL